MALFEVVIPIAGHAFIQVEAETEVEAIRKGFDEITIDHIEDWEPLGKVSEGNVCYFPRPWEVKCEELSDE